MIPPKEHTEQVHFFNLVRFNYPELFTKDFIKNKDGLPELQYTSALVFAIPNGGARDSDKRVAAIRGHQLKLEGVQRGVPDIFVAVPKGRYNGLFIEMKRRKNGSVGEFQKTQRVALEESGYKVVFARGCEEAYHSFECYMATGKETE